MKHTQRFLTFKGYSATSMFLGQPGYLSIYLAEYSHYTRSVSLLPPQREYYFQVSPRKIFENFPFSPVSQAIPTDVLRQGENVTTNKKRAKITPRCDKMLHLWKKILKKVCQ